MDHVMKLLAGDIFSSRKIPDEAGIEIAGACAHRQTGGGGEAHGGINAFSIAHSGHACAIAEMGKDNSATRDLVPCDSLEFLHQVRIGKTVESESLNALSVKSARDRQDFGDTGHLAMKGSIEAGD